MIARQLEPDCHSAAIGPPGSGGSASATFRARSNDRLRSVFPREMQKKSSRSRPESSKSLSYAQSVRHRECGSDESRAAPRRDLRGDICGSLVDRARNTSAQYDISLLPQQRDPFLFQNLRFETSARKLAIPSPRNSFERVARRWDRVRLSWDVTPV